MHPIRKPNQFFEQMQPDWKLVQTLWGGTRAMRAESEYLPKEPLEEDVSYRQRVDRTFLVNYLKAATIDIVSRPFAKPVQWDGETKTKQFCENPAGQGYDMSRFMRNYLQTAIKFGIAHALIDMGQTPASTLDQLELPIARILPPTSVIGWTWNPDAPTRELESVRILESAFAKENYDMKSIEQVRVFTKNTWEIWREVKSDNGEATWSVFQQGTHTFGRVPLITLNLTGEFMEATPPLIDLAWLNVAHWQSTSDQRNALRFARIGMMFFSGVTKQEIEGMIAVGPNKISWASNPNADAKFVEHSGAAMKIGAEDISKLEQQMEQLGVRPLVERSAQSTATGKGIDENRAQTTAQVWAGIGQDAGEQLVEAAAKWLSESEEKATLTIFTEFDSSVNAPDDKDRLMKLRAIGDIDRETHLLLQQRRGLLPDSMDVKKIALAAANESSEVLTNANGE